MFEIIEQNKEFTGLTIITLVFLIASTIMVTSNKTIGKQIRSVFIFCFVSLFFFALFDWVNYLADGRVFSMRPLHIATISMTFALAPFLPTLIAHAVFEDDQAFKPLMAILGAHAVFELISGYCGFVFVVDASNAYSRGPFYFVYMLVYTLSACYLTWKSVRAGATYQCANLLSVLSILFVLMIGVVIQVFDTTVRTTWPAVSMAVLLYFLFYVEMVLTADPLTMLLNRVSYEHAISAPKLPLTYVAIDINRFKQVNDTYGHAFGDVVLRRLAHEILKTYGPFGRCYRVGGDEFCAILTHGTYDMDTLSKTLADRVRALQQKDERIPSLSVGYATADETVSDLAPVIDEADQNMYTNKWANR